MISRSFLLCILFLIIHPVIEGQEKVVEAPASLVFELPLVDLPYQLDAARTVGDGDLTAGSFFSGYSCPGMQMSLSLSSDLYTLAHLGIYEMFDGPFGNQRGRWTRWKQILYAVTLTGADFIMMYAPGFGGWEHEEYHRAVLTRFHVSSINDMNRFPLGAETVSVSHVLDEDLVRFKQTGLPDFVRAHEAGIEGEYLLVDRLQRNNFYYNNNLPHELFYLMSTLNSILYVTYCSDPEESDPLTDLLNASESTIEERDFTGLDFLAWTYDIFRPTEPYEARGIHPSGTGLDRYIKTTDLKSEELQFLKKQGYLQWLNMVSPMMMGFRRIRLSGSGWYGNFSMHHYLTSFGNDISCNVFLMNPSWKLFFALHSYQNHERYFPAIEAQMIDWEPFTFAGSFYFSPRIIAGFQPAGQSFMTTRPSFLGLTECRMEYGPGNSKIHPYIEISLKSEGWIAGNEFLESNFSGRMGLMARF